MHCPASDAEEAPSPEQKAALDALHLHKIDLADRVLIVNPGGYLGVSTRRELAYAQAAGKPISFTDPRLASQASPNTVVLGRAAAAASNPGSPDRDLVEHPGCDLEEVLDREVVADFGRDLPTTLTAPPAATEARPFRRATRRGPRHPGRGWAASPPAPVAAWRMTS